MRSLYPSVPENVCGTTLRFKQDEKHDKKTEQLVHELWEGIEGKCKDVGVKECQVLINGDSGLNNKMSVFVNHHTQNKEEYVNHSDKDIHDINVKILNEIQE